MGKARAKEGDGLCHSYRHYHRWIIAEGGHSNAGHPSIE